MWQKPLFDAGVSLSELVDAINAVGATPWRKPSRNIGSIKRSGRIKRGTHCDLGKPKCQIFFFPLLSPTRI